MPTRQIGLLSALLLLALALPIQARTLETAFGPVSIEGTPNRIVALHEGALDTALALEFKPVAAVSTRGADSVASYVSERAGGIAIVGKPREINLEAIASQRPDIILAGPLLSKTEYQRLSKIAPTFVPIQEGLERGQWKQLTRFYARALGAENKADALIAQIQSRAEQLAEQVHGQTNEALVVRWMPQGAVVMSDQVFSSDILASAGFTVDDKGLVSKTRPHSDPLSLENLGLVDRDWLFLATLNDDGDQALAQAKQSAAFNRLDVVSNNHVIAVDGQLWSSAAGPLAAHAILDDIEQTLMDYID